MRKKVKIAPQRSCSIVNKPRCLFCGNSTRIRFKNFAVYMGYFYSREEEGQVIFADVYYCTKCQEWFYLCPNCRMMSNYLNPFNVVQCEYCSMENSLLLGEFNEIFLTSES